MKKNGKKYVIYIDDGGRKYWLHDIIASDYDLHPVFASQRKLAMKMRDFDAAMGWREKLLCIGYAPHIVSTTDK